MTVYWLVWDAAASWVVDALLRQGQLPALRELRGQGVWAAARPPRPNCQTPTALATLFTGKTPAQHGVLGFTMPAGDDAPFGNCRSGFGSDFPLTRPLWEPAMASGRRATFSHVPWVIDSSGAVPAGVNAAIEAYSQPVAEAEVLRLEDGQRTLWWIGDQAIELRATASGVHMATKLGGRHVRSDQGWKPLALSRGVGCWVRVLPMGATGKWMAVHTAVWRVRTAGARRSRVDRLAYTATFAGDGVGRLYRTGAFGPRLVDGGDGLAEAFYASSLECVAVSFAAAANSVIQDATADLVVAYLPVTDDVGHELIGWCDERSARSDTRAAPTLWTHVARCYAWSDAVLGRVLTRATADDTVLVTADHGIAGSAWTVHVNEALVAAGLASVSASGALDLARSHIVYHPANNGMLTVNHDRRPGGRVIREQVAATVRRAIAVLKGILTPGNRRTSVVRAFCDVSGRELGPADVTDAHDRLFVVLRDDHQPAATLTGGAVVRPSVKSAVHTTNTGSARLHGVLAAAGPGLPPATDLGTVDTTFAAQLAIAALDGSPAQARKDAVDDRKAGRY